MTQTKRYELWQDPSRELTLFPEDNTSARRILGTGATQLAVFEADSWEAACQMEHDFMGWEPYVSETAWAPSRPLG